MSNLAVGLISSISSPADSATIIVPSGFIATPVGELNPSPSDASKVSRTVPSLSIFCNLSFPVSAM